jgi:serine/threonine protein kinase
MATIAGRRNRNDLFSADFSILPPGKASTSASPSSAPLPLQSPRSQATFEADAGIALSSSIELCRSEHRLGHGRHADVYLGSYRENGGKWRACAVKRLGRDKEARSAGLNESALLQQLSSCPQVVTYLGLKEESEEAAPRTTTSKLSASAKGRSPLAPRYSPGSHSAPSSPSHEASGFHFEDLAGSLRSSSTVKASQPRSRLSLQGHDGAETLPPPSRLLLLTHFYPLGNLADFVSKFGREYLGCPLFFKLASDLLKAVVACHAADIIHADVKPQNCMVRKALTMCGHD